MTDKPQTTLLQRILCRFGVHDWKYEGDTLNGNGKRTCYRCGSVEVGVWSIIKWVAR